MFQLVKNYVATLSKEKIDSIARQNNIVLNEKELDFLYRFIHKNYEALYVNPYMDLSKYKVYFEGDNFKKIMDLIEFYKQKYAKYLN